MIQNLHPHPHPHAHGDRGSVSIWLVIFAFVTIVLLVLVVDGGQLMNDKSRTADIAEQAARAQLDDLNLGALRAGQFEANTPAGAGANAAVCDSLTTQLVQDYSANARVTCGALTPADFGGAATWSVTATVVLTVRPALPAPWFPTDVTVTETAYLACGSATQLEAC
jgi:Flp pilus assembly protein TadG